MQNKFLFFLQKLKTPQSATLSLLKMGQLGAPAVPVYACGEKL